MEYKSELFQQSKASESKEESRKHLDSLNRRKMLIHVTVQILNRIYYSRIAMLYSFNDQLKPFETYHSLFDFFLKKIENTKRPFDLQSVRMGNLQFAGNITGA